ncbi:MAG: PfkB family carbohydrate kinase [Desulfurococcales archaeon]|nr:PfkB family carbohydrate kinase [Desulfurococcales archaeon]
MKEATVVGNINIDITFRLPRLPNYDENIQSMDSWTGIGGSAVNYSVMLSRMGWKPHLIAVAGKDANRQGVLEWLQEHGIQTDMVRITSEEDTGKVVVLLTLDADSRTMITYRGANTRLDATHVECRGSIIHYASVNPLLVSESLGICTDDVLITYDPGGWVFRDPYGVVDAARQVDVFHVNLVEATRLEARTGLSPEEILGLGGRLRAVSVKKGREGAIVYSLQGVYQAYYDGLVYVEDTTGAGDSYDAAFDAVLLETGSIMEAVRYGVAAGALKVGMRGSSNMPEKKMVEKHLSHVKVLSEPS